MNRALHLFHASGLLLYVATAQGQTYNAPAGWLYQVRDSMEARFDSLRAVLPDSVLYHEGGEYAEFQKWFRHWELRMAPHGDREVYEQVMKSYSELNFNEGGSFKSNTDPWLELGPRRRTGFGIGPIRNIVINSDDPDHMLCTSSSGGLFYSTNAGEYWHNAGTDIGWPHSGCQGAAYYPGETDHWYALSTYDNGRISYVGGVYRTSTGGAEWEPIADADDLGGPGTQIQLLLFDRKENAQNDHRLLLATSRGIFISDDPASADPTWTLAFINDPTSILSAYPGCSIDTDVKVHDIEYLPYDPLDPTSTLCAAMRFTVHHSNSSFHVWRFMISEDNGDTWNEIPNQPSYDPKYYTAAVETSQAAGEAFYCLLGHRSSINPDSRVWVYNTVLDTWELSTTGSSGFDTYYGGGHGFGIDQTDASSIYVSNGTGLRRYFNGTFYSVGYGHVDIEDITSHPNAPNVIWVAHHGGVDRTTVSGTSTSWMDMSDGLGVAEVDALANSESEPDYIVASWFHDGSGITRTPYSSADWDPDWVYLGLPYDGTRCLMDPWNPDHMFQSGQGGVWRRHDQATTSTAFASGSFNIQSQWWSEGELNRRRPSHLYRATLVNNGSTTQNSNGTPIPNMEIEIFRSFDRGVTNVVVSTFKDDIEVSHPATLDYKFDNEMFWWIRSSPANPDHLYVAMRNYDWQHRIYRNMDIDNPDVPTVKAGWEEVPHPRRAALGTDDTGRHPAPVGIAFDPEDENRIFIAYASSRFMDPQDVLTPFANNMVYMMNVSDLSAFPATGPIECGGTYPCQDITMNLPNNFAGLHGLVYEQGSDDGLYLATDVGVYFTNRKRILAFDPLDPADPEDLGNTAGWVRLGNGLPHVSSNGIVINYHVNRIRNGLFGRGVWEHSLHCPDDPPDHTATGTYTADDFIEASNDIVSTAVVPSTLRMKYRAGHEIRLEPGFHAVAGTYFHAFIHPCDTPGNSFTPKALTGDQGNPAPASVIDRGAASALKVYPNPNSGLFTAEVPAIDGAAPYRLTVLDAMGRTVASATMGNDKVVFDLSGRSGLFLVVAESGSTRLTSRIIIQ
jgi:hypothetical protein